MRSIDFRSGKYVQGHRLSAFAPVQPLPQAQVDSNTKMAEIAQYRFIIKDMMVFLKTK
jgi:hypothetical protein